MKLKKVLIVHMDNTKLTLRVICRAISKRGIVYTLVTRRKLHPNHVKNKDLVISVGGDGTFLRAAHYVKDTPVLVVSPDIKKHDGFFARANRKNFETKLEKLVTGKCRILELTRLQAKIGNKRLEYSLNEIYVGSRKAYLMSKYNLKINGRSEFQKSSGVLIGTAAGSHAWIKAASGQILSLTSKKYQFVVREPFAGKFLKYKMLKRVLASGQQIKIVSQMKHGAVVADSVSKPYKFNRNSVLTVNPSMYPLKLVSF
jgi:NAD+ kinase